jgi:hypothetical protein
MWSSSCFQPHRAALRKLSIVNGGVTDKQAIPIIDLRDHDQERNQGNSRSNARSSNRPLAYRLPLS